MSTDLVALNERFGGVFREYEPGTKITVPGAYLNMPMNVYHGRPTKEPSVSSTGLRTIFQMSPAHFWQNYAYNPEPDEDDSEETKAMILGRAAHHLLLGEKDFYSEFVMRPEELHGMKWQSNRKDCKQWVAEHELDGYTILTNAMLDQIKGMARGLSRQPLVQQGILNGVVEVSMFWRDEETGVWLKSRPDNIPNDSGDFADLKCVADITSDGISRGLSERGYHQQGALVGEGSSKVLNISMQSFSLVYVEQKTPFWSRVDPVSLEDLGDGVRENHAALRLFKKCWDAGYWPGPENRVGDGGFVRRSQYSRDRAAERVNLINQDVQQ